jgi:glycosyltransferase involved in cell wall biosynthesis
MRILFLDQFSELGGAQRCLSEFCAPGHRAGWEAHAAVPGHGPLVRLLEQKSVQVHRLSLGDFALGRKRLADVWRFLSRLSVVEAEVRTLVNRLDPAVIYVNGPRLMPAVWRAARGRRIIFHTHNAPGALSGGWMVSRALHETRASIIAASRHLAAFWRMPARVIYGGVAGPPNGWSRMLPRGGARVGLIGRFAPQKGQREFVTAAASLRDAFPDARFLLCGDALFGDSNGQHYQRHVLSDLPSNVRHLGWRDDVYEVLKELDLLVVPSRNEGGIPTVILEAFSTGVAVLATPSGGAAEIIKEGENGFLLASPRVPAITGRLRELFSQPGLIAHAADAARREWRKRFHAEIYRSTVWDVIEGRG